MSEQIDPMKMAEEMMVEVRQNAHASLNLVEVAQRKDGPLFRPGSEDEDIFDCGVMAGYTETMRMLIRRGLLPGGETPPSRRASA